MEKVFLIGVFAVARGQLNRQVRVNRLVGAVGTLVCSSRSLSWGWMAAGDEANASAFQATIMVSRRRRADCICSGVRSNAWRQAKCANACSINWRFVHHMSFSCGWLGQFVLYQLSSFLSFVRPSADAGSVALASSSARVGTASSMTGSGTGSGSIATVACSRNRR